MRRGAIGLGLLCGACAYVPPPGDPAPPDRPAPAPSGGPALPTATRWDGGAYCRAPFSGAFGWADPIGHVLGFTEAVEHLAIVQSAVTARGLCVPSPDLGANDEVDVDGDWNFLVRLDPGQERLLAEGNFDPNYGGGLGAEIVATDLPAPARPVPGDRVTLRGDWVVDCWHDFAQAEIHPAFALLVERGDERLVNVVRRSGVFTDLVDGIRDDRVDPAAEVELVLVPPGTPLSGQRAVLESTLERLASGVVREDASSAADGVHLQLTLAEEGHYYGRFLVAWR